MVEALLRLPEVRKRVGLSRSSIYAYIKAGKFPRPIALGPRAVAFSETEISRWIAERIVASREAA